MDVEIGTTRTLPPYRGHCSKRDRILSAALAVFCREGYSGASIDMIAAEAGVSRQTVYNHVGDKENLFVAIVTDITERSNADIFRTLATFPDRSENLEAELVAFGLRLVQGCLCDRNSKALLRLIHLEGRRYPELFAFWRQNGPAFAESAIAARFQRMARDGALQIEDPALAARQFVALVTTEFQFANFFGETPSQEEIETAVAGAVRTFLRAFGGTASRVTAEKARESA